MFEVELVLAVDVGEVHVEQPAFLLHLLVERRARHGRIQHELVKVGVM